MKKIAFYGASVTAQTGGSSYFEKLANLNTSYIFSRLSFPSSQFNNAGFFNSGEIKKKLNPELCFLEWSTTGEGLYDFERLIFVIKNLIFEKIIPTFLILPQKSNFNHNRGSENQIYAINEEYKIPILDLRYLVNEKNFTQILRDDCHTTEVGAGLYADEIIKFIENYNQNNILNIDHPSFFDIKIYDVEQTVENTNSIKINYNILDLNAEICVKHTIGPYSPVIIISSNGMKLYEKSIFDQWCYFERENFTTLINGDALNKGNGSLIIKFANFDPNYAITKTQEAFVDTAKKLKIDKVYTLNLDQFSIEILK